MGKTNMAGHDESNLNRIPFLIVACAVVTIAIGVRLRAYATAPLWTDELFTAIYARSGLLYMWTKGLWTEPTPPPYYMIVAAVEAICGTSAWALRLPSLLGSLVGVFYTYQLSYELFRNAKKAFCAVLLLALAPANIFFATEARAYALQTAALTICLLGLSRFLRNNESGVSFFSAGAIAATWLHPTSLISVISMDVAVLTASVGAGKLVNERGLQRFIRANIVILFACIPLIPSVLFGGSAAATAWIDGINRYSVEKVVGWLLAGPALSNVAMQVAERTTPILALLLILPPWGEQRRATVVLILPAILSLLFMITISLYRPILLSRTILWMLTPLAVALGNIVTRRPMMVGLPLLLAVGFTTLTHLRHADLQKENWPAFFARLPEFGPPALIVFAPHTSPATLELYGPKNSQAARLDDGLAVPETTVIPRLLKTRSINLAEFDAAIASGRPVWLIARLPELSWIKATIYDMPPPTLTISNVTDNSYLVAMMWNSSR